MQWTSHFRPRQNPVVVKVVVVMQKRGHNPPPAMLTYGLATLQKKWLGRRDSNPTYLIQSQAFYR